MIAVYAVLTAAASATGYLYLGAKAGTAVLAGCLLYDLAAAAGHLRRAERMRRLAERIDAILHGAREIDLSAYAEGELSVLRNELEKMTARLQNQADLLRREKNSLADSLADISHQLRTPLTAVNLMAERLSAPDLDDAERRKTARELRGMLGRLDWLITSLLKLSRLDAGTVKLEKTRVGLRELIRRAAEPLLVPMELHGQELTVDCAEEASFTGDPAWTAEAVGNLLKNAVEHTPDGGRIAVSAAETALGAELIIRDSGPGIAPEDLPHLFERFYRGKNAQTGFGIGLALARSIIVRQDGTLQAENARGGGAVFTVRFYKGTV